MDKRLLISALMSFSLLLPLRATLNLPKSIVNFIQKSRNFERTFKRYLARKNPKFDVLAPEHVKQFISCFVQTHGQEKIQEAFVEAIRKNDPELVRYLLVYAGDAIKINIFIDCSRRITNYDYDVDIQGPDSDDITKTVTPLVWALEHGYKDIADVLLKHGVDVNANFSLLSKTPLQAAVRDKDMVAVLLERGAKVNNEHDKSLALAEAVKCGQIESVELLLKAGANANSKLFVWPVLTLAAGNGSKDIVELLLKYGADVNHGITTEVFYPNTGIIKNVYLFGSTALEEAAIHCYKDVVEILLRHGAQIHKDSTLLSHLNHKTTPLHDPSNQEIIDLIMTHKNLAAFD